MINQDLSGFEAAVLPPEEIERMAELAGLARADILAMTTLAGSGHPGGSLSSVDVFLTLWSYARVSPETLREATRDRIVVSHGHTAAAVYAVLGHLGYFELENAIRTFRKAGSPFEGHPEREVPGVEWTCGNLGQGLSAACGMALAARPTGCAYQVFCVMGDGEQQKGQISEARRFAVKNRLENLTAIIDCNGLQAMGAVDEIMPQNLEAEWLASGWDVLHADGHSHADIYAACHTACSSDRPTVILAHTVMGKGVPDIEDRYEYHGKILSRDHCRSALETLNMPSDILHVSDDRCIVPRHPPESGDAHTSIESQVCMGSPRIYSEPTACRDGFGNALEDLAVCNQDVPIAVFDCDLAESVKTDLYARIRPQGFFQCGIQEHSAAVMAGAASISGVLAFYADFAVFALDEAYNQQRLNDINDTSIKLILTHCGLDVGEDGKTHQCIDYIGLAAGLNGFKLIIPADANQADRATRYIAATPGRFILAMGRSKMPLITDLTGAPMFGGSYAFEYGSADWIRDGSDGTIIVLGNMVPQALDVRKRLLDEGVSVGALNLPCPLDLDGASLRKAAGMGFIVTYEDHCVRTGIGSLAAQYLMDNDMRCKLMRFGVTSYGVSGSAEDNYRLQGLDAESVSESILGHLRGK